MSISLKVVWTGQRNASGAVERLRRRLPKAFRRAVFLEATELLNAALKIVPVAESKSPSLRDTGRVRQIRGAGGRFASGWEVVFDAPHAVPVHEGFTLKSIPPGENFELWGWKVLGVKGLGFVLARRQFQKTPTAGRFFLSIPAAEREKGRAARMVKRIRQGI